MRQYIDRGKLILDNNRKRLAPLLLLSGFVVDVFTYRTLKPETTFMVLGGYAMAAALGVVLGDRGVGPLKRVMPLVLQFAFGALLSSAFLFYWFGGSVAASWPVMLVFAAVMVSNEAFRALFLRPTAQFATFAFTFFSYCTLLVPFMLRSVAWWAFVFGGVIATLVTLFVAEAIVRTDATRAHLQLRLRAIAGGVFAAFVALYFLNFIPPIPLSIRDAGFYHDVKSSDGKYNLVGEDENVFQKIWPGQTLHLEHDGDKHFYAYTAIYAPTSLSTTVVHVWQRYNESKNAWVDFGRSSYVTRGGRQDGYRGYSYRTITQPGEWRVIVESERGQELGRFGFTVVE